MEAAALEKIYQGAYATDIRRGDPNTVSVLLTSADIQRDCSKKYSLPQFR